MSFTCTQTFSFGGLWWLPALTWSNDLHRPDKQKLKLVGFFAADVIHELVLFYSTCNSFGSFVDSETKNQNNYKPKASQAGRCIPTGCNAKVLCNVTGVNYYINSNRTKYLTQTLRPIVYVSENFHRSFANFCGTTYRRNYETFTAL